MRLRRCYRAPCVLPSSNVQESRTLRSETDLDWPISKLDFTAGRIESTAIGNPQIGSHLRGVYADADQKSRVYNDSSAMSNLYS
jgi:hypothetical protein